MADPLRLTSTAFEPGESIPEDYTCEGDGISPPLAWTGAPRGTNAFALVMDDPDAPRKTFVHWVLYNLPPDADALPEDLDLADDFAEADTVPTEGACDYGDTGYGPPCPPPGHGAHRYTFRLYALDAVLDLASGATKKQLTQAMQGHVLAEAELVGTYERTG